MLRGRSPLFFLATMSALGVAGYGLLEARRPRLIQHTVFLPFLSEGLNGMTILHLSDLHVNSHNKVLSDFLIDISTLKPDLAVITGDFVAKDSAAAGICAQMLKPINATQGVYAVLGNHDHYRYPAWSVLLGVFSHRQAVDSSRILQALEKRGLRVLTNESIELKIRGERVYLAGIDDMFSEADDLPRAAAKIEGPGLKILLSHSPDVLDDAASTGFDLVLSGHTHGGQIRLPVIGALTTHTKKPLIRASGVIYRNNTAMHISQGLGTTGLPLRFLCPPEATLLQLLRK